MTAEFGHQGLTGAECLEERAGFVQYLLGDSKDDSSKVRPFLWKTAYDPTTSEDEKLAVHSAAMYCSLLIGNLGFIPWSSGGTDLS